MSSEINCLRSGNICFNFDKFQVSVEPTLLISIEQIYHPFTANESEKQNQPSMKGLSIYKLKSDQLPGLSPEAMSALKKNSKCPANSLQEGEDCSSTLIGVNDWKSLIDTYSAIESQEKKIMLWNCLVMIGFVITIICAVLTVMAILSIISQVWVIVVWIGVIAFSISVSLPSVVIQEEKDQKEHKTCFEEIKNRLEKNLKLLSQMNEESKVKLVKQVEESTKQKEVERDKNIETRNILEKAIKERDIENSGNNDLAKRNLDSGINDLQQELISLKKAQEELNMFFNSLQNYSILHLLSVENAS